MDLAPLDRALRVVGDRWSLLVVAALLDGPRRFGDLEAAVPGIATNVLTQWLKRLEADRLVVAVPYSRRPVRYAYELTERGAGLADPLDRLANWGTSGQSPEERVDEDEVRWF